MKNFLSRLFGRGQTSVTVGGGSNYQAIDPTILLESYVRNQHKDSWSPAGVPLALAIPVAYDSIVEISNDVTSCEKHSYKETNKGREISYDPVDYLFNGMWNKHVKSYDGLQAFAANYVIKGQGIARINWMPNSIELYNLDPDLMDVSWTVDDKGRINEVFYVYNANGNIIAIPQDQIFHVQNCSMNEGLWAANPLKDMCGNLRLGYTLHSYTSNFFEHGAHQSRAISCPTWFTPEQFEDFKKGIEETKRGLNTPGQWVVLQGGMSVSSLTLNNEDAALIDSRNYSDKQIRIMLGTWYGDGSEEAQQKKRHSTLKNFFRKIQNEVFVKLYTEEERKTKYFEYVVDDLIIMDQEKRYNMVIAAMNNRLLTNVEGRLKINECKPEFAEGEFLHPANLIDPDAPLPEPQAQPNLQGPNSQPEIDETKPKVKEQDTIAEIRGEAVERWKYGVLANKYDCTTDIDSFTASINMDKEAVLNQVEALDCELKAVLPEQRLEILRQWKVKE